MSIDQVTEAFAKIAEDFKVKPMQGASLESDLSTGFTLFILFLVSRFSNGGKSGEMRTLGSHGLPWVPRVPIR